MSQNKNIKTKNNTKGNKHNLKRENLSDNYEYSDDTTNIDNTQNINDKKSKNKLSKEDKEEEKEEIPYPNEDDKNLQQILYKKREFYSHKISERPEFKTYEEIEKYRTKKCLLSGELLEHQAMLGNFINPDTPYKGILGFHGTGTGKTCLGVSVSLKFIPLVQRYGTKIYILVPGPLLKESWKDELIKCSGDFFISKNKNDVQLNDEEKQKQRKQYLQTIMQYYNIMSYKTFYKKVLGEKIRETEVTDDNKIKSIYKKTDDGEFEREIGIDRIYNLNNTLIIADEAHNLTGNTYGEAFMKIIKNSINLKILLLTASPMKNLGHEIVELLNFIRPIDSPMDKDKIFTSNKNYTMQFKEGGLDYLTKMCRGYVSCLRGADPITFAKRIDMGIKPKGLLFTKIIKSYMNKFQLDTYNKSIKESIEENDALDKSSSAVANFVFPGLDPTRKIIIGLYGVNGLNEFINQMKNHSEKINNLVAKDILKNDNFTDLVTLNDTSKNISGNILLKENLKYFSTKFSNAINDIFENLFNNNKQKKPRIGFIYCNQVVVGIDIFEEVLLKNGFLRFDENKNNYSIKNNTICYHCSKKFEDHIHDKSHSFSPATFLVVTGGNNEESIDNASENNKRIISTIFNNNDNIEGKNIKLILGSKVMNEGISLFNVFTVQILDVYYNFGRVDQVIGRAIRWCSHFNLMTKENPYPEVLVYKYSISFKNENEGLTSEEILYQKAEKKYLVIKKVEKCLRENAIDCPLNYQANVFKEEVIKQKKCLYPTDNLAKKELKNTDDICPSICDFNNCFYKCSDELLNSKYYDPNRLMYKNLTKKNLDYSTFTNFLAKSEIDFSKKKIRELYMMSYVYNLQTIINYVKDSYPSNKKDLFDDFFVQKALDELIPITENDFNNFKDIIYDKNNRLGYLIYLDGYYLFQPFDEKETSPIYYRTNIIINAKSKLSLSNYLQNNNLIISKNLDNIEYNFDSVMDYYDNRKEFEYVGIVDQQAKKNKNSQEFVDVFKIREQRSKILDKKRGTGIPSLKGAVCVTAKSKEYLLNISKILKMKVDENSFTRDNMCDSIKNKLIDLEKYSTGKHKITYIIIPFNHSIYKFPLNLEDRSQYIKNKVLKIFGNITFDEQVKNKLIELSFKLNKLPTEEEITLLTDLEFKTTNNKSWKVIID
jgi:superfamily II DNA or RNA helicase